MSNKLKKVKNHGALLIGWDLSNGNEIVNLTIGKKDKRGNIEIINYFKGDNAIKLFDELTGLGRPIKNGVGIFSWDFSGGQGGKDKHVLISYTIDEEKKIEVKKVFVDNEAHDIYKKLMTKTKEMEE